MNTEKTFNILGEEIPLGTHKILTLKVGTLPTATPIEIPIYVYTSKNQGRTLLLQAGLHGDEINGVESLKRLIQSKDLENIQAGTIIVVPLINIFGFLHFSREIPNGKDLNRSFPGTKTGSLASRIAHIYYTNILQKVDLGIDLHTGGNKRSNYPQTRYATNLSESEKIAKIFNAPFSFESKLISKSIRKTASDLQIPFIVYEGGESMRFDEYAITEAIKGIKKVLHHYGYLDSKTTVDLQKSVSFSKHKWIRAKQSGMFTPIVKNGASVIKNEVLGKLTDVYGDLNIKVRAQQKAVIFCVNNAPIVNKGDALFHIGFD